MPPIKTLCEHCRLETSSLLVKDLKKNLMKKEQDLQAFATTKTVLEKLAVARFTTDNKLLITGISQKNLDEIKKLIETLILNHMELSKSFLPIRNIKMFTRNSAVFEVTEYWKKIVILEISKEKLISSLYKIQDLIRY